ncbi:MAG: LytTR family DNA-binding domain-containing protein [Bacteroidota bacterium]
MDILIIEDELNAFEILQKRLAMQAPQARVIGHLRTIVDSINWFKAHPEPDLVFLDIELTDGQSFEIFKHVSLRCPVIFTTAYDQYAIKAFTLNSLDYLLKPISEERLQQALDKYQHLKETFAAPALEQMQALLAQQKPRLRKRFLVSSGEKYHFIKAPEIAYFYSEDGVSFVRTLENRRHLLNDTLDSLEKELDPAAFFRINRKQIVQLDAIQTIHEYFNHRFKLDLKAPLSDHEFIVSRLRRTDFKNWLNGR